MALAGLSRGADGQTCDDLTDQFDQLLDLLDRINIAAIWNNATDAEGRTLLDELVADITVHPDRLVVGVHGAPKLNVALAEVGLGNGHSGNVGVGGGT